MQEGVGVSLPISDVVLGRMPRARYASWSVSSSQMET